MIEFIQLIGIEHILFLAGLVLYVVIIFIVLSSDSSSRDQMVAEGHDEDKDEEKDYFSVEDAPYTVELFSSDPKFSGALRKIFRKRPKADDLGYL